MWSIDSVCDFVNCKLWLPNINYKISVPSRVFFFCFAQHVKKLGGMKGAGNVQCVPKERLPFEVKR